MPSARKSVVSASAIAEAPPEAAGIVTRSRSSTHATSPVRDWQHELAQAIRSPEALLDLLDLSPQDIAYLPGAMDFPLFVPRPFASRMQRANPNDPLLRQVLPLRQELVRTPGYTTDPLEEQAAEIAPGLLQKYPGRALLIAAPACAVHCRYCFRRHYPYGSATSRPDAWLEAVARIAADPSIREVILSGGDPLMLSDRRLAELIKAIAAIGHVTLLRIHTRLPVVIPNRVTESLCTALESRLATTLVLHCNHAAEIDDGVARAVQRLRATGCTLLNQSVLLDGVNNDPDTLARLSFGLHEAGVLPYYLHLPDQVAGTSHFSVSECRGRRLIRDLRDALPGYLVPRLVREVSGAQSKQLIV